MRGGHERARRVRRVGVPRRVLHGREVRGAVALEAPEPRRVRERVEDEALELDAVRRRRRRDARAVVVGDGLARDVERQRVGERFRRARDAERG